MDCEVAVDARRHLGNNGRSCVSIMAMKSRAIAITPCKRRIILNTEVVMPEFRLMWPIPAGEGKLVSQGYRTNWTDMAPAN